jgi:diguanylate cyclase (GGDEF)-like protein/PAS domain S-box-containing protein
MKKTNKKAGKPAGASRGPLAEIVGAYGLEPFVAAFDAHAAICATDVKGKITYVNDAFQRLSKYGKSELVGKTHRILNSGHHSRAHFNEMWATVSKGKTWRGELKNSAKDGSIYWLRTTIVPFKDDRGKIKGFVSGGADITAQKVAEERLNAQSLQLDTALDHMARGLSMFDASARLMVCNKTYRDIYGLPDELAQPGTPLARIVRFHQKKETGRETKRDLENQRKWIKNHVSELARGKSFSHTQHLKDGRIILVTNQPLAEGGWVDLQEDITEKRASEAKIVHMAHHDALTGLPNRTLLGVRINQALSRAPRGDNVAVYLLDLDHFKAVNDSLGHAAGDELLKAVVVRLARIVRTADTVARMGGDELAIVQRGIERKEDVEAFAQRIIERHRATAILPRGSSSAPTWRCTRPRSSGAARTASTTTAWMPCSRRGAGSRPISGRRSGRDSSSSSISRC